ncbi:MAG: sulfate reduction electron transfer complex DsrMKJOP subunit DsrM [Desulfobacteraceae bacterium]|nr:sulfate reduction electron transfer complex DsrMKJOP subunit DsrM [Desulfobacteraceae bacterium]MCF8095155.1 sulfate reduction electron transfer complex DsrMKJOP subunit DsrM [Desulfobacteraceae bacterium]
MKAAYLYSLIAVVVLGLIAYAGVEAAGLDVLFGVIIPYLAFIVFLVGFANKVLDWSKSAVPFKIPTTMGQQKSLPWIKQNKIDSPYTTGQVVIRMLLEILLFRSLFKNTRTGFSGERISYKWVIWLWLFAILFHYSFLVVVIRHLRFFAEPVPFFVNFLEQIDGMLQVLLPHMFLSGFALLAGTLLLLVRRVFLPKIVYISRPADYFPLFLITGIAVTGLMMRYLAKVDVIRIKELTMGLATLQPSIPEGGISGLFYVHLFFVSILVAYIPFSKIMHIGGIFLSPTRNTANDTRARRHVNPWNYPVKTHTYEEYEEEFRDKMKEAGIPVEKE